MLNNVILRGLLLKPLRAARRLAVKLTHPLPAATPAVQRRRSARLPSCGLRHAPQRLHRRVTRGCHEVVTRLSRGCHEAGLWHSSINDIVFRQAGSRRVRVPRCGLMARASHGPCAELAPPYPPLWSLCLPPPPIPRPLLPVTLLTPQAARQGPPRTSRGHTHTHSDARTHSHTPPRFDDYSQGWYAHGWRFAAVSPAFRERGERGRGGGGKSYPVKFSVENLTRGGHGRGREGVLDWVSSSPSRT